MTLEQAKKYNSMTLPDFLTIARVARHIPARVEAAVKAACEALKNEIENYLNNQK